MKDLNYYLKLPYTLKIEQDTDYDGSEYFIAKYEELDGLALRNLKLETIDLIGFLKCKCQICVKRIIL
ncbi:hypothetical protein GZH82_12470 [Staphylococcus ursi]|uniref:hypothetical protein n=1 Tax=Staphylococcus sp. MI 10-1553 TaxID=1912064 RepID=UPI0013992907|nr:hypothetical protein [Staphylococcus sp. MI 10-1553]QHW35881.1 hypothetical protein GZH82_12470 [Staphylococcus sp. MI 10-1553]